MLLVIYLFSVVVCLLSCVCVNDLTKCRAKEYEMTKLEEHEPISLLIVQAITSLFLMLCPVLNTFSALILMYILSVNEDLREEIIENQLDKYYE